MTAPTDIGKADRQAALMSNCWPDITPPPIADHDSPCIHPATVYLKLATNSHWAPVDKSWAKDPNVIEYCPRCWHQPPPEGPVQGDLDLSQMVP